MVVEGAAEFIRTGRTPWRKLGNQGTSSGGVPFHFLKKIAYTGYY